MAENVRVAIRVRPFNSREKELKCANVVQMSGSAVQVTDPASKEVRSFSYDFCYDSFDSSAASYADQKRVFADLGTLYLENVWSGYNTSIFAYGQTGSGKSYSMMGYGENVGIIPLGCAELFRRIEAAKGSGIEYQVEASFLEIYMEEIRDLLASKPQRLSVREHPRTGVYVEGLIKQVVRNYKEIERVLDSGNKSRTVAATNMNATSSRSHSVFSLYVKQVATGESGAKTEKLSKVHLIDLAGSERQDKTGATGARLKEAGAINKSLSSLGNVINALAEARPYVPYRDSVLTTLLRESLGGNAKTIMIAAISPADNNFDETLGTLRYASRAKTIQNKAVVNESPQDKLIRELREEIESLKAALAAGGQGGAGGSDASPGDGATDASAPAAPSGGSGDAQPAAPAPAPAAPAGAGASDGSTAAPAASPAPAAAAPAAAPAPSVDDAFEAERRRIMAEKLAAAEALQAEMSKSYDEKVKESEKLRAERDAMFDDLGVSLAELSGMAGADVPQLVNVAPDPQMSGSLVYFLKDGTATIGSAHANKIVLSGRGMADKHASLQVSGGRVLLAPAAPGVLLFVNGTKVDAPVQLAGGDRVIVGDNYIFRFRDPKNPDAGSEFGFLEVMQEYSRATGKGDFESPELTAARMADEANDIGVLVGKQTVFAADLVSGPAAAKSNAKPTFRMACIPTQVISTLTFEEMQMLLERIRVFYDEWSKDHAYAVRPEDDPFNAFPADQEIAKASIDLSLFVRHGTMACRTNVVDLGGRVVGSLSMLGDCSVDGETTPLSQCDGKRVRVRFSIPDVIGWSLSGYSGIFLKFDFPAGGDDEFTTRCMHADQMVFGYSSEFDIDVSAALLKEWGSTKVPIQVYGHVSDRDSLSQQMLKLKNDNAELLRKNQMLLMQLARGTKKSSACSLL